MKKIRFLESRVVRDEHRGTPSETRFEKGQVVEMNDASANHWLIRGAAEICVDPPVKKRTAKKVAAAKGNKDVG